MTPVIYLSLQFILIPVIALAAMAIGRLYNSAKWKFVCFYFSRHPRNPIKDTWLPRFNKPHKPFECTFCMSFWLSLLLSFYILPYQLWPVNLILALGTAYFSDWMDEGLNKIRNDA